MKTKHRSSGSKAVGCRNSTGRQFKLGLLLVGTAALMNPASQQQPLRRRLTMAPPLPCWCSTSHKPG